MTELTGLTALVTGGTAGIGFETARLLRDAGVLRDYLLLIVDKLIFERLRSRHANNLTMVFASFGAALILRNLVLLIWGPEAHYYTTELQIAVEVLPNVRMLPDQIFVLLLAFAAVAALQAFLRFSRLGIAMRAMAESPSLARVCGIEIGKVIRWTWILSGALAAAGGVFAGLTVQLRPEMGFNLLLSMFTAAILGGAGSLIGAVVGGLAVGLAENLSVLAIPAGYKAAVPFLLLLLVLFCRPQGLFGSVERS